MRNCSRLFIGGSWVEPRSTPTLEVVEGHTEQVIGQFARRAEGMAVTISLERAPGAVPGWFR